LTDQVWDNPQHGEIVIGICLLYDDIAAFDLCELFEERYREGDFCVLHVLRNPVACFVSWQQARRTGIWRRSHNEHDDYVPASEFIDVVELTHFVRAHDASLLRIKAACRDHLEIKYQDLFLEYQSTMRRIFEFLEVEPPLVAQAGVRRLLNQPLPERVRNWDQLMRGAPSDVRNYLTSEDLF